MNRQELVLVVSRNNIQPETLQPLQLVIPTMQMTAPFSLYTSSGFQAKGHDLYDSLARSLQVNQECSISQTLKDILESHKKQKKMKFRVCLLGGSKVNWDTVLEYKRHNIIIDTAGSTEALSQVSHTTGGISKKVDKSNLVRTFLTSFSKSTEIRKYFFLQKDSSVNFHMQAECCRANLPSTFFVCSVCMNIYCNNHVKEIPVCLKCNKQFDKEVTHRQPDMEIALLNQNQKTGRKVTEERVDIN